MVPWKRAGRADDAWLGRKVIANTVASALVWLLVDYLYVTFYLQNR